MMTYQDGYIPDVVQAQAAAKVGQPSDRERLLDLASPWDVSDIPPVTTWETFASWLNEKAQGATGDAYFQWWQLPHALDYFTPSQEQLPDCAGFAMANAYTATLLHQVAQWSEQLPAKINPMATWVMSKDGSTVDGQTISAIALAGNTVGNYTTEVAGEYDQKNRYSQWRKDTEKAALRQIGVSLYEGKRNDLPQAILDAQKLGRAVIVGNNWAISGTHTDRNGVICATIGGMWAHATCIAGYQRVGSTEYVYWINSHGNIYETDGTTPAFGCWMDAATLERFCHSRYCDAAFVTYAEAPYDPAAEVTLTL